MKKSIIILTCMSLAFTQAFAQLGVDFEKTFGGTDNDFGFDMAATGSGGYILAGYTDSGDDDVTDTIGNLDFWIVEIDADGVILWEDTYGGTESDFCRSITPASDGGWIVVGSTFSTDGDITDNAGNKDGWILKIDADGTLEWQHTYGGEGEDQINDVIATSDGGYFCVGASKSLTGDVEENQGLDDYWLLKLDADGELEWVKNYGGTRNDIANAVVETTSGYYIAGSVDSNDGDVVGNHSPAGMYFDDYWILHIDATGELVWAVCYGGEVDDAAEAIVINADGNFVIAGSSKSNDGDVSGHHGDTNRYDYWVIEIDADANLLANNSFGGTKDDECYALAYDLDGGYILAGESASSDEDVTGHHGGSNSDFWVVKTDADFNIVTTASLGGSQDDAGQAIIPLGTEDYVGLGFTKSEGDDVSFHHGGAGNQDYWFVNLGPCSLNITSDPEDVSTCEGSDVTLTVGVTGSATTYTWEFLGGPTIVTSTSTLFIADVTTAYSHEFYVIASGSCGTDTSETATLYVEAFTTPDISPAGPASLCATGSVVLSTTTTGTGYSYQWQKDGTDIAGATGMSYTATEEGFYTVTISNTSGCSATSAFVEVTNEGTAAEVTVSGNTNICATGSVTLTTTTTGAGYTYQWYKDAIAISGATGTSLVATEAGSYYVVVTTGVCVSTSATISVTNSGPTVTISATGSLDLAVSGSVTINSSVSGTGISYQWLKDGSSVAGAVGSTLIVIEVGSYQCAVTNISGCSDTSTAIVVFNSVAINELVQFADITMYPNPNNGVYYLHLENISTGGAITVEVLDVLGNIVYTSVHIPNGNALQVQIDGSTLASGNYFTRILSGEGAMVRKISVNK
jgi:hypothetical protein